MRLQPLPDKFGTGMEMNRIWRQQQEKAKSPQKANTEPRHGVVAADKPPVIHPDTPVNIPVDAVFTSSIPDTGKRFQSFLKVYKNQIKAKQDKPIAVKKQGDVYILIDGSRRLAAARMLKMPSVKAIVVEA